MGGFNYDINDTNIGIKCINIYLLLNKIHNKLSIFLQEVVNVFALKHN
jgi:hypothetical protein